MWTNISSVSHYVDCDPVIISVFYKCEIITNHRTLCYSYRTLTYFITRVCGIYLVLLFKCRFFLIFHTVTFNDNVLAIALPSHPVNKWVSSLCRPFTIVNKNGIAICNHLNGGASVYLITVYQAKNSRGIIVYPSPETDFGI